MSAVNVVLFVADDLGWGDLGCYGATRIPTPNLDAAAARGVRYLDCHAASSVCSPSRYALLTGRHPWRSPLQYGVLGGTDPALIRPGVPTIASVLREQGYTSGAFGKWHLGLDWTLRDGSVTRIDPAQEFTPRLQASGREVDYTAPFGGGPLDLGFDRFFGIAGSLDMPPYCFLEGRGVPDPPTIEKHPLVTSQRPGLMSPGWSDDQVDLRFTEEACGWIQDVADGPFFLYLASAAPHRPCVPPEFVRGTSGCGARGDSVALVDWMFGQVVEALDSAGVLDHTIVVFTSDNGAPTIFPEDGDVVGHRPNGAWRGQKADAFEGGYRVPLIVAGPGVPEGVQEAPVSLLDLLPSAAGWAGAAPVAGDGRAIGDDADRLIAASAYDGRIMLRDGATKAIYGSGSGGFSDPIGAPVPADAADGQFYDLGADPAETANLWPDRSGEPEVLWRRFVQESHYGGQPGAIYG